jgi:hypothetical protein
MSQARTAGDIHQIIKSCNPASVYGSTHPLVEKIVTGGVAIFDSFNPILIRLTWRLRIRLYAAATGFAG